MMQGRRDVLVGLGSLALVPGAFAHHGWSSFDQERPIWLEGKVMKVAWRNPHAELELTALELPRALEVRDAVSVQHHAPNRKIIGTEHRRSRTTTSEPEGQQRELEKAISHGGRIDARVTQKC